VRAPPSPARALIVRYCIALSAALAIVVGSIIGADTLIDSKIDAIKRVHVDR
jgi:hypothetical protein